MYYVYVLKSKVVERYYIGSAEDVVKRLESHNGSHAKWTRRHQPWELVHQELFETRGAAMKRERELKALKNVGRFLDQIRTCEL